MQEELSMSKTKLFKSLAVLITAPIALSMANGTARAVTFSAPLIECGAVSLPAALSCGNDPLTRGEGSINDAGTVAVSVTGAGTSETYGVTFQPPGSGTPISIGSLTTGGAGNGNLEIKGFFQPVGSAAAGTIVLTRGGQNQYVSGVFVPSDPNHAGPDFNPGLIRCADVNHPAALTGCGTDTLKSGNANIAGDSGDLAIFVHGAGAKQSYAAVLRSTGGTELALGTVTTDKKGNGSLLKNNVVAATATASGTIVLKRNGDQFMSGFKVSAKPATPTDVVSLLVQCGDVTDLPLPSTSCGTDPLTTGTSEINANGQIRVSLTGAEPSASYEVFFRPLDNPGDVDTKVAVTTDSNGDVTTKFLTGFASGTIGSGSLVLEREGFDQFVTGFIVK